MEPPCCILQRNNRRNNRKVSGDRCRERDCEWIEPNQTGLTAYQSMGRNAPSNGAVIVHHILAIVRLLYYSSCYSFRLPRYITAHLFQRSTMQYRHGGTKEVLDQMLATPPRLDSESRRDLHAYIVLAFLPLLLYHPSSIYRTLLHRSVTGDTESTFRHLSKASSLTHWRPRLEARSSLRHWDHLFYSQ